jgi:hypothetical protein
MNVEALVRIKRILDTGSACSEILIIIMHPVVNSELWFTYITTTSKFRAYLVKFLPKSKNNCQSVIWEWQLT